MKQTTTEPQDKHERQRVLNPRRSYIVQAPAGSGKTELLIQRFLLLLSHVNAPEEILAITFTKKAANEMRARIIRALKESTIVSNETTKKLVAQALKRDAEKGWNLLENPSRLRIQTIDSLNAYLTRQLPILSHLGHPPAIADNPHFLYQEAVQELLNHLEENLEWSDAIGQLLLHIDNNPMKLNSLLVDLLAKRDQWLPYIILTDSEEQLRHALEEQLTAVISETLRLLREQFPKEHAAELIVLARMAAKNLKSIPTESVTTPSPILYCEQISDLPGSASTDKVLWLGLAELLFTKENSWRKRVNVNIGFPAVSLSKNPDERTYLASINQRMLALIKNLSPYDSVQRLFAELAFLPEATFAENQWQILKAVTQILKILVAQLRITFQRHGQIDYIENAQAALFALGNEDAPTDLALALDYQIQHILVDEFQDTAYSQYRLIEKLTTGWQADDGRTLFIVGDPMQSIYRFREAEVGLFIRACQKGIGHIPLEFVSLSVNFRSTSSIVNWINQHFKSVFPVFNDVATGAVTFHPSIANQVSSSENISSVHTSLFINAANASQAQALTQTILEIKKNYPSETIAILVRSRTHLEHIIPALKSAQLVYRAIDIDPLIERQSIQDLYSLTRALLHPADRLAWLSVLRAPWCGLSLTDLWTIAHHDARKTIYEQLQDVTIAMQLSAEGKQRLSAVLPLLKHKLAERRRLSLRSWIESTWLLLGGPACLKHAAELEDAAAYFQLLEALEEGGDIVSFTKLEEAMNKLFAGFDIVADDSLQIMTIHGAKGLEFDNVIVPHLERKIPSDDKALLSWMERPLTHDESAFLLAPIHATGEKEDTIYEYIKRQQTVKSDYETVRLLYVAATRAKKHLFLLAQLEKNSNGEILTPTHNTFLAKLWPAMQDSLAPSSSAPPILTLPHTTGGENSEPTLHRLTLTWQNPIHDIDTTAIAYHRKQGIKPVNHDAQHIGTLTHHILQKISQNGTEWWQNKNAKTRRPYLLQCLTQLGILPSKLTAAVKTVQRAIENTLNDSRGQWILTAHPQAQSELGLTAIINGEIKSLIIDRTFVDDQGTRWIIDYKTSTSTDENLQDFLAAEQTKYHQQMQYYHDALKLMDNHPIRIGLYFPLIPAWCEWGNAIKKNGSA